MDKKDLSQKIFDDIKEKEIKPKPKWQFTAKNILFAAGLALFLAFGSLAFSVMLFLLINNDWNLRHMVAPGIISFLISTFPYIWIVFFIIFLFVSYIIFRKINGSYRFKISLVIILGIIAVLVIGSILYTAGLAKKLDFTFRKHLPKYQEVIEQRNDIWLKPEKGVLIGKVMQGNNGNLYLMDPRGNKWTVDISSISEQEKVLINEGWPIKIIGELSKPGSFKAKNIYKVPKGFYLKKMNIEIPLGNNQYLERNIYQMRII